MANNEEKQLLTSNNINGIKKYATTLSENAKDLSRAIGILSIEHGGTGRNDGVFGGTSESAECSKQGAYSESEGTASVKIARMNDFEPAEGSTFPISFKYENLCTGQIKLNINETDAKLVYINGAITSGSNYQLGKGPYLCRYDGTNYYIDTKYFVTSARNASWLLGSDGTSLTKEMIDNGISGRNSIITVTTDNNALGDNDTFDETTEGRHPTTIKSRPLTKLWDYINSKISTTLIGVANGVANLDANGKVPSEQLPSYVDDVIERNSRSSFPTTGETGKIYVDTSTNLTYRWGGTSYVEISPSLALGETSTTAYRGDHGKTAYDHSQLTSGNPHGVTKSDIKLENVANIDQSKAIKEITRSGTTFTVTALDGSTTTFTQQDNYVTQQNTSTNSYRRILLSGAANDTVETGTVRKCAKLTGNPATGDIKAVMLNGVTIGDSPKFTDTTYSNATTSADGLMSSTDKTKLNGIETGAQVNTITGVKGNSETSYRTGNVNITPANIGLGNVNNTADSNKAVASAEKLTTARKVYVKLGTASTTETKDFSDDTAIPVSGTLGVGNGGTGQTTLVNSANALINSLTTGNSVPSDNDYFISQYVDSGTTTTTYHRRPLGRLWDYIKGKLSITTSGNGNAITALSFSNGVFTATKGSTFLTSHQDISGKANASEAGYSLAVSGTSVSLKNKAGTVLSTITTQDTNTWRGIQDSLTSDSSTDSLSAKQGKALASGSARDSTKLPLAGGTMTGALTTQANLYEDSLTKGAIHMASSNIDGLNSIYTADLADNGAEGIHFYRDATHVDSLWVASGQIYFVPNRAIGTNTTAANSKKVAILPNSITSNQVVVTDGTGGNVKASGYTIATSVPANAVFTDTDTKNTAGSTDTSSKIFLIGATTQAANPQTYSDNQVYVTSGTLQTNITNATAGINANTANSGTAGGVSLYGTYPDDYGIIFRQTSNKEKHGYVQGDWATYLTMNNGGDTRGWVFRQNKTGGNVASISGAGNAVFNGSVTIGGNQTNTSGARMQYNSTTKAIDFVFA